MDAGNTNAIPDYSALRILFTSNIRYIKDIVEQCENVLNRQESILSFVTSTFTRLVSQEVTLEGSELKKIRDDFEETRVQMAKVTSLLESMKVIQGQVKDKQGFISSHISEHDCRSEVSETQDLIEMFDTRTSLIFETINQIDSALFRIKERVRALVETYSSSSDLDE
ncbi:hypothetical protein TNCT_36541 [Trichonephila clavata]|uniref:Uncharacterized protein n=1 Tax=Trichonephila clavata TaxID=2740835 RepID=A0A8X6GMU3_TRICU|nr:hypothetical protein TNCT_36541 [Trichonephila clavata]